MRCPSEAIAVAKGLAERLNVEFKDGMDGWSSRRSVLKLLEVVVWCNRGLRWLYIESITEK